MKKHSAVLLLGSNIEPEVNILRAMEMLAERTNIVSRSRVWETEAVGSDGPNFLNVAICIETDWDAVRIKADLAAPIENLLGRVRSADKNMPRTMDIDVILFDNQVIDAGLWEKAFIAIPVSEVIPDLPHPITKEALRSVAAELKSSAFAEPFQFSK